MSTPRHLRMTEADKARKVNQQRERRKLKPSVSASTRRVLNGRDSEEVRAELGLSQGGLCGICKKPEAYFKTRFHIDHNHHSGKIRGLLCFSCNHKLGFVEKYYEEIAQYLMKGNT